MQAITIPAMAPDDNLSSFITHLLSAIYWLF